MEQDAVDMALILEGNGWLLYDTVQALNEMTLASVSKSSFFALVFGSLSRYSASKSIRVLTSSSAVKVASRFILHI